MYQAPPVEALVGNLAERQAAQEKLQKSNFSLADGLAVKQRVTTQSMANNLIRQTQWNNGEIQKATIFKKPADSINFGQNCEYTSETKQTFVASSEPNASLGEPARIRDKLSKPNINFGSSPAKQDTMMTVAMANDKAIAQVKARQPTDSKGY